LEKVGLKKSDREDIIQMVMEVTGVQESVDEALTVLQNLNSFGLGSELLNVTEKIGESFEQLRDSLSNVQKKEMERKGFTFMEPEQMRKLHKEQGLNKPQSKAIIQQYDALPREHREEALWAAIVKIAGKMHRQKRQLSVLQPLVFSPFLFAPIVGLTVLGPIILSPNLFSPLVLAPVLSPVVLSPTLDKSIILSAYVLSPYILSPAVHGGNILSPYVLSLNILNPAVAGGAVFSPFVLSPNILSPSAVGGLILSPNALSPSILSPTLFQATVLSQSFLS
uniref:T2SSF domain-containing protein n=1 Tax=Angiostrongylus cantonensis TaxID=6313 RepID=A0A0K0DMR1_ANGCA